jgi:phosphoribosylanthranilate isomerase
LSESNRKNSVRLKVCGLKDSHNLKAVVDAGVDLVGLIFYPPSPRCMADILLPEHITSLPDTIQKVGVFVNQDIEVIIQKDKDYQLDIIQLHGYEQTEYCARLQTAGKKVMKAFGVDDHFDFRSIEPYLPCVDFFLFDTKSPQHGGSGIAFNWNKLKEYPFDKPFFVGGGVGLENLETLLALNLPHLYAVDMNSRLEIAPGLKDIEKVKRVVDIISKFGK